MKQLTSISNDARQKFVIPLDNGEEFTLRLYYYISQYSWFFDIEYKNYVSNGNRLTLHPNILRNLRDILPFGIAILADSGVIEPYDIADFSSNRLKLYILNSDDVQTVEENVYNAD